MLNNEDKKDESLECNPYSIPCDPYLCEDYNENCKCCPAAVSQYLAAQET